MEESPYASRMVEIHFGVKKGPLRVPSDLLKPCPALYNKIERGRRDSDKLYLERIDIRVGHILVDFLYRRRCVIADDGSESKIATGFEVESGQEFIRCIYDSIQDQQENGVSISITWKPTESDDELLNVAKRKAKDATREGARPEQQFPKMLSTTFNIEKRKLRAERHIPENVEKYSKSIDTALPGEHTKALYEDLPWNERTVLAQLRTYMIRLNGYLHQIRAVPSSQCACELERETIKHFLFRCPKWEAHRKEMTECTDTQRGNISFYVGGKSPSDGTKWKPNMTAVRATIRSALATGRLSND